MRSPLRIGALLLGLGSSSLGLALAPGAAWAAPAAREPTPDEVERARTFFAAGAQAYASARYADAARSFEQAYQLAPRPQLAFSLAQAERKEYYASSDPSYLRRALQHYKEYLEQVPSGGRRSEATEAKADLEARLTRLDPREAAASSAAPEKRKARITVHSATAGAQVSIDGGPAQELPYFGDLEPGRHKVKVFAEGYYDEEREISGDKAIDQPVDLPLRERPAQVTVALAGPADIYVDGRIVATAPVTRPIEVPPGPHVLSVSMSGKRAYSQDVVLPRGKPFRFDPKLATSGQRVIAYSVLGVSAATLITGGVFGIMALGQEGRATGIADDRAEGNISADRLESYNRSIERRDDFRTVAIATLSAGGALGLIGGILYFVDRPAINVVPPRSVEPTPTPRRPDAPIDVTAYPVVGPGTWGGGLTARF